MAEQQWAGVDGATAWHLIDRQAEDWADVGRMMQAWLDANRGPKPAIEQAFAFVLKHGLPMKRRGWFRYHGVTEPMWHPTVEEAIRAAMADPAFAPAG